MAIPVVRSITSAADYTAGTNGNSLAAVTLPSTTQPGDLILVFAGCEFLAPGNANRPVPIGGGPWSVVALDASVPSSGSTGGRTILWAKTASTAGAQTFTVRAASGADTGVHVVVYVMVGAPAIVDSAATSTAPGTTVVAPSVTPMRSDDLLVCAWEPPYGRSPVVPPTGMAGTVTSPQADGASALTVARQALSSAAATGTRTGTYAPSSTSYGSGLSVVLTQADKRSGAGTGRARFASRTSGTATRRGRGNGRTSIDARADGLKRGRGSGRGQLGHTETARGSKSTASQGLAPAALLSTRTRGTKSTAGLGLSPSVKLRARGIRPSAPPVYVGRPLPEDPLPMSPARYLVQNVLTREWLHTDLPLSDDQVTLTLSGPCEITGKLAPEQADLLLPDGTPLVRSWGHILYLEIDGEIRAAGLITEDSYDDQAQTLTCKGVSAYPGFIPYDSVYAKYFVDPLQVVIDMWAYVQSLTNANIGVSITRSGRPARVLGNEAKNSATRADAKPSTIPLAADDPTGVDVVKGRTLPAVYSKLYSLGYRTKPAASGSAASVGLWVSAAALVRAYREVAAGTTGITTLDATMGGALEPFSVYWFDVKMCGQVITDAIKAAPADYVEQYRWKDAARSGVVKNVHLAYPRVGRRRDDLRFVSGENIVEDPTITSDPDSYATAIIGIGAGEGSLSLRSMWESAESGRLRKPYVYRNSGITDRAQLRNIVAREGRTRSVFAGQEVSSIVVAAEHINARFGEYNVGDDIYVQVIVPWRGWIRQWCRIVSMVLAREQGLVQINLHRSDTFFYGAEVETSS